MIARSEPVIHFEQVAKTYKGRVLYDDVSFDIRQGTISAIAGPNGSGKSVLFRLMCRFIQPDSGTITIHSRYLSARRTFPERFGVIIDRPGFIAHETGLGNLQRLARIRNEIGDDEIFATMRVLGLDPELKTKLRDYSLGMKQKVGLAQALMEQPEVLLLDEPFNGLDAESVTRVRELLWEYHDQGKTVVFTSHNTEDIRSLAQSVLQIENGRIMQHAQLRN